MKFIPIYISPELKCQTSLLESRSVILQVIPPDYILAMMFYGVEHPFG